MIKSLETRPAKLTQSAEESSLDAWLEKYPYYRLPERSVSYYDKGQIVGVLLDLEIRRVTRGRKSLRDLFQWMNSHYAKQGKFFNDSEGIREAAEAVTGAKFDRFFDRYVSGTEVLPYDEYFATVGLKLDQKVIVASDAGFTAAINFSPYPIINSVLPGSEAEKAGVRPGDTVVAVNGSEPSANVVDQISGMRPGSIVRLKLLSRDRTREVKFKLTPRKAVEYYFAELPNLTKEQQLRRAAWVRGDSEASE
jgi:predicted metalloprotease with PDZ domain